MWNQPFSPDIFEEDPYDRFAQAGGVTSGKGDWAWLQHTVAAMNDGGRAAVVLDTGAMTRGSGSRNEDKERNIRKWFVDHDYIEGVILLPDNLFYNTPAPGTIVILNKRKPVARKDKVILVNASRRFTKGKPKNHIADTDVLELARLFQAGEPVDGELAVVDRSDLEGSDYNLNPAKWVSQVAEVRHRDIKDILAELDGLDARASEINSTLYRMLVKS
jgi:type I restriction enzyme M protein